MPKNWNRRFKHNRDKMKTGDILELAEVVRNLVAARPREGSLDRREADVREGEEDPRQRADVREGAWTRTRAPSGSTRCSHDGQRPTKTPAAKKKAVAATRVAGRRLVSVWAVIVAAGRGERLGVDRPKAFARLGGRPLLAEPRAARRAPTGSTRSSSSRRPAGRSRRSCSPRSSAAARCTRASPAATTRADSVRAGVAEVPDDALVVLVHDAARPLVCRGGDRARARAALRGLGRRRARAAGRRTRSSASARRRGRRRRCPRRSSAPCRRRRRSSPTCSRAAVARAREATDCAALVEAAGGRVKVVEGDPRLLKVTTRRGSREDVASWL